MNRGSGEIKTKTSTHTENGAPALVSRQAEVGSEMGCLEALRLRRRSTALFTPSIEGADGVALVAQTIRRNTISAGVEPVHVQTRDATKRDVLEQRQSAMRSMRDLNEPDKRPAAVRRRSTRLALDAQPKSMRMSRVGSAALGLLVKNIETASKEPDSPGGSVPRAVRGKAAGLEERLRALGLSSVDMEPDGNCQFRAVADQLFGSQEHHAAVRAAVVAHMKRSSDFFSIYFESSGEYSSYLRGMGQSRTWGDELTLRAAVEAFGCVAHVVTSEEQNWYLVYNPDNPVDDAMLARVCKRLPRPAVGKEIFINYISPIHYNAVRARLQG